MPIPILPAAHSKPAPGSVGGTNSTLPCLCVIAITSMFNLAEMIICLGSLASVEIGEEGNPWDEHGGPCG